MLENLVYMFCSEEVIGSTSIRQKAKITTSNLVISPRGSNQKRLKSALIN
jgi:hypothetical protein